MEVNIVKAYKVESDSILMNKLKESEVREKGFFLSPYDAVNYALEKLSYLKDTTIYRKREKILNKLLYAIKIKHYEN